MSDSTSNRVRPDLWGKPDPAVVLAGACLLSTLIAVLPNLLATCIGLGAGLVMLLLAGARPGLRSRFLAANLFVCFMWLIVPLTMPGPYIWQFGVLSISRAGLDICLLLTLKANAILAVFLALVAPMPLSLVASGLAGLHCPDRLTLLLLLLERNVHLLRREWGILRDAAMLRAFAPKLSLGSYRILAAMLAQLLLRAYDRGQSLHEAMLLAGFAGRLPWRSKLARPVPDVLFSIFIALICSLLVFYAWICP